MTAICHQNIKHFELAYKSSLCLSNGREEKWILSLKYLICRICPQRWTITVEAWEGPKAWWTNEENGVCVGYFVSVTPGVTLQSIQCQSNCEDKTGRANQCIGSQTARSHERAPLFHGPCSAHEKLQPCLWTWTHGDQSISRWWALQWFPNKIMPFDMPMHLRPAWRWYYLSGW